MNSSSRKIYCPVCEQETIWHHNKLKGHSECGECGATIKRERNLEFDYKSKYRNTMNYKFKKRKGIR